MKCPSCQGARIVKNGSIHNGKPKWLCKDCRRQFVATPTNRRMSMQTKQTVDKLLLERLSLAGIVRSTGVSARWLHYYVNTKYADQKRTLELSEQKKGH